MNTIGPITLIGPPGSGKSTQGKLLAKEFQVSYLSTGDLLRKDVSEGTEIGRYIEPFLAKGDLVPRWAVREVVDRAICSEDARRGFVIDGYPRTVKDAKALDQISFVKRWKKIKVIEIKVPEDEILKRLRNRGRGDDSPEVVKHRLEVYERETRPVLHYYQTKGQVTSVDGTGEITDVYNRIIKALKDSTAANRQLYRIA